MQWFTRIVGVVGVLIAFVGLAWFQLTKLPNLAEDLPANTQAFSVVNSYNYPGVLPFATEKKWAKYAWIDEQWQLWSGRASGAKLIDDMAYQNVRKRLRYNTDAFVYMEPASLDNLILPWMHEEGLSSTGTWMQLLQRFPALGLTLDFWTTQEWYGESFIAVDKEQLSKGYFVQPNQYYSGELLQYAPENAEVLIGGMNAHDLWELLAEHMQDMDLKLAEELLAQLDSIPNGEFLLAREQGRWRFIHRGEPGRRPDGVDNLLPGSDLFVYFQVENDDKSSIIVSSGIKPFDDGLAARHLIQMPSDRHR